MKKTSIINFEGIGLNLNINNVFLEIKGVKIYWYAICIVIGLVVGLIFCERDDGKYKIQFNDVVSALLLSFPVSLICARLYFVLFKLEYYAQKPLEIFNIRNGGLAIYGGIFGLIISLHFFCKRKRIKLLDMLDYVIPYLALGQSIGRWGNFFNVEAYGTETKGILRMGIFEDGRYIQVHPTFLYESIVTFIIFCILYRIRNKRKYSGQITCMYFLLYGIARFFIEGLRTDSLMMGNLRVSQVISILLFFVSSYILISKKVKYEKKRLRYRSYNNITRSDDKNIDER